MRQPRVFHLLQKAHTALFRAADHALKTQLGLSTTQQAVLFSLAQHDGAPISQIADQLHMGYSSLTGLVDRMETRGLVTRRQNQADARSVHVFIEDKGRAMVQAAMPFTKGINAALLEPFSPTEQNTIERFLDHVATNATDVVDHHANNARQERFSA
ncbi:MAG: MarR family winged helix-turn-helix transcriptional regulator [Pseudomonadota bacterium]